MIDKIEFSIPKWNLLCLLFRKYYRKKMRKIFAYKHDIIEKDLAMFSRYPFKNPKKILISGSHGFIGISLVNFLIYSGHDVKYLVRKKSQLDENSIYWNPHTGEADHQQLEGFDAVVHLAGENIGKGRWSKKRKRELFDSRCVGTAKLVALLSSLKHPPKTFLCASAIGYYGNRDKEILNEESSPGKGLFISEVCEQWENATQPLKSASTRVVNLRFGMVLSSRGGALKKMLFPFLIGFGGRIGSGEQYMSWIAIDDVLGSIYHSIMTPTIEGSLNVVTPNPVKNDVFVHLLAKHLNRWLGPPLPEFLIQLLFGQKGYELLLMSSRAEPEKLIKSGYIFRYPKLKQALEHVV